MKNPAPILLRIGALWLGAWLSAPGTNLELEALVAEALARNPVVQAARFDVERAQAERDELRGFFDPQLQAEAARTEPHAGADDTRVRAGLDAAVRPGAYLGARLEEGYVGGQTGTVWDSYSHLWQTAAELTLEVPLHRDRRFRQWALSDERAVKRRRQALNRWRAACQDCRHAVEQSYLDVLEAESQRQVSELALARVEKLLGEARELVRLKIVPEYQLFTARAEVTLRREALEGSRQDCRAARIRLNELLAAPAGAPPRAVLASYERLILWAESVNLPLAYAERKAFAARGDYNELLDAIEVVDTERALQRDNLKSDFSLDLAAGVRGEDPDSPLGTDRILTDETLSTRIGLTWKRPWGYQTETARLRALDATVGERREQLREAELRIASALRSYHQQFLVAQDRLSIVGEAIGSSRQALEAENERFCLGEGRSRNVLDAQKDLTDAQKRQIVIAVELLRSYSHFLYSAGYAADDAEW